MVCALVVWVCEWLGVEVFGRLGDWVRVCLCVSVFVCVSVFPCLYVGVFTSL